MSSHHVIQTGIESKEKVEIHGNVNMHISTPDATAAKKPKVWKQFCTVSAPFPYFVGRKDLIATMHRQIRQCSKETEYSKKMVIIYGLGGMGKSELVRKYVQEYQQDPVILNAAWINAESNNSLESSFKSLAEQLLLPTKGKQVKDVVSSVYKHLADHSQPSLFIFDNVNQMRSEDNVFGIFEFLPTVQLDFIPLIIITTRVNNWEIPEDSANIIQINELSEDAGIEFLTKRFRLSLKQKEDKKIMDALKNLTQSLQCFPLALTLAASNIPLSKLRSIPKEIEDYIQKLNGPHGGWIDERHSTGAPSNYDYTMNNVWAATLNAIQSHRPNGDAAISFLNIIAYFPPDQITVENVVKVAQFSGLPTNIVGFEMLELYSLISLPSSTNDGSDLKCERSDSKTLGTEESDSNDEIYQDIRIHRLVQRCTRDKLDREKNYTHLLKISLFLAHNTDYFVDRQAIHEHLKTRMWPENSIQWSILFAFQEDWIESKFEIVKDVHQVLVLKDKPGYAQDCTEDYKILHELNLFRLSTCSPDYKKLCEDLIAKDPFYSGNYLEQVFVSCLGKCVKDLFMGTMDTEDLVKRAIFRVAADIVSDERYQLTLCKDVHEKISLMHADATGNCFKQSMEKVGSLYSLLWRICWCFKRFPDRWCVQSVLKIHSSVYASIRERGGDRLDSYWENDLSLPYFNIVCEINRDQNGEWVKGVVESFCTQEGLTFLLQHLQYLDDRSQPNTHSKPYRFCRVLALFTLLGWKWNCTKDFVLVNLFMETLYSITKNFFKSDVKEFFKEQFHCLMTWFGLFGKKTFVDNNGLSWSIQSVEKEILLLLGTLDQSRATWRGSPEAYFDWIAEPLLIEFIESSGSDQESIAVKTAKRMQNCSAELFRVKRE